MEYRHCILNCALLLRIKANASLRFRLHHLEHTHIFYKKLFIRNPDSRTAKNLRNSSTGTFLRRKLFTSNNEIFYFISRVSSAIKHFCDKETNSKPTCIQIQSINGFGTSFRQNDYVTNMDIQETLKNLSVFKVLKL